MTPDFYDKWSHIIDDVDKNSIPLEFIKKLVVKLRGKRQKTINVKKLMEHGFPEEYVEEAISKKLAELDDDILDIEFILDVEGIAQIVQHETDRLLGKL